MAVANSLAEDFLHNESSDNESTESTDEEPSDSEEFISSNGKCYRNGIPVHEDDSVEDKFYQPANRDDTEWCHIRTEDHRRKDAHIYGKWLVFKDYDELNLTWKNIVQAIKRDELEGCCAAKCSTLFYNPSCAGPGPSTHGVVCVYTYEDDIDNIGFKLIDLVKQDIKYKTDEATLTYKYAHVGMVSTIKTLYYNGGNPSFELTGKKCFGTSRNKEDIWHVNEVVNPESFSLDSDYGRWILTLEYEELSELWQNFKDEIHGGSMQALKMVCPPKRKRSSQEEKPVFHVYTTKDEMKSIGSILISIVRRNIKFEKKDGYPHYTTLYWNKGEYAYEEIRRRGITKNWRTGEDLK